jgi:NAD+ kinase
MRIGVVGNQRYDELREVLAQLTRYASRNGHTIVVEPDLEPLRTESGEQLGKESVPIELLITLGGDGTLLRGVRLLNGREVPILGINLGQIGFLTATKPESLEDALQAVTSGTHHLEQRAALEVEHVGVDGAPQSCKTVVNDVVVHKAERVRIIRVRVAVDGEEVGRYTADGIIVATPAGSTAYSLSAGGPVMLPAVDAMVVTPICPHTLRVRPIVIPGSSTVTLEVIPRGSEEALVSLDGQIGCSLMQGERIVTRRSPVAVHLVRLGQDGFFTRMRQKLEWGDLSDRERLLRAD